MLRLGKVDDAARFVLAVHQANESEEIYNCQVAACGSPYDELVDSGHGDPPVLDRLDLLAAQHVVALADTLKRRIASVEARSSSPTGAVSRSRASSNTS